MIYRIVIVLWYLILSVNATLSFDLIQDHAPWMGRQDAQLHILRDPIKSAYNGSIVAPSGSLIIFGGITDRIYDYILNDIWVSQNSGVDWIRLEYPKGDFPDTVAADICTSYYTDRAYVIFEDRNLSISQIWTSGDYQTWESFSPKNVPPEYFSPFLGTRRANCLVDSFESVYYLLGQNLNTNWSVLNSEIWASTDQGETWFLMVNQIGLPPRSSAGVAVQYANPHLDNADIFYVMGGTSGDAELSDLWASSDGGQNWIQILNKYPWYPQSHVWGDFAISPDGILISSVINIGKTPLRSEFWVSLDGGYHWGFCNSQMPFGPRIDAAWTFDLDGYLYAVSGLSLEVPSGYRTDVWKSQISFENWTQVATQCNLELPVGGIGLTSWPDNSRSVRGSF